MNDSKYFTSLNWRSLYQKNSFRASERISRIQFVAKKLEVAIYLSILKFMSF